MKLQDLPQFDIRSVTPSPDGAILSGRIVPLAGVRPGRSWLYAGAGSLIGDLSLGATDGSATFVAPFWTLSGPGQVGDRLPWIDGYWQAAQIMMILDPTVRWSLTHFLPSPAQYFKLGKVTGSQQVGGPLPADASPLHIDPVGWDHEHCELCGDKIGHGGAPDGYRSSAGNWLCAACYTSYAAQHSLSFLVAT